MNVTRLDCNKITNSNKMADALASAKTISQLFFILNFTMKLLE